MKIFGLNISKAQRHKSTKAQRMRNAFTGAKIGRLSADQPSGRYSIDWDIRASLPVLVARSRHLWQNNPYAKKFFHLLKTHVVGPYGVTFQNKALKPGGQELDLKTNKAVVSNFNDWAKSGNCDVTGKLSWVDIQNLYIQTMAQDGEVLMREIKGFENNKWAYALQFIDTDCLDVTLNKILPDGNIIKMGVELNRWNRPVAYWLLQRQPGDYNQRPTKDTWERVPADQIIHDFEHERTNQTRGIPWMHAVMMNLAMLGGATEAEVVAFRAAAAKMGLITEPEGEPLDSMPEATDDQSSTDTDYSMVFDAEAGSFLKLPKGYGVEMWDPKHPNTNVPDFAKFILKGTSSGLGPSYPTIASDLEGVNYTSIRAGLLDERDFYKYLQNSFLIQRLHGRVTANQLKMSMLAGAVSLPMSQFERIYQPKYQPRTWEWVDPLKEVAADVHEINAGLTTRTAEAAKRGLDFEEDILRVKSEEKKLMEKYGVTFPTVKASTRAASIEGEDGGEDEEPVMPGKNGNGKHPEN